MVTTGCLWSLVLLPGPALPLRKHAALCQTLLGCSAPAEGQAWGLHLPAVAFEQPGAARPGTVHSWARMHLEIQPRSTLPHSAGSQGHLELCRLDFTQPLLGGVDRNPHLLQQQVTSEEWAS